MIVRSLNIIWSLFKGMGFSVEFVWKLENWFGLMFILFASSEEINFYG